jgi:RNA polymerase sigma-70 factor, ECF subfamily
VVNSEKETNSIPAVCNQWDERTNFIRSELPKVFNLCAKLCLKKEDAEDLCQEVFIKALKAWDSFREESSRSTWLYRITMNAWKNRVRYEKRRFFSLHISLFKKNSEGIEDEALPIPDNSLSPEAHLDYVYHRATILHVLDKLNPDEKAIIALKDLENQSYEEISAILGLRLGTVKSRLSRARDNLRMMMKNSGNL